MQQQVGPGRRTPWCWKFYLRTKIRLLLVRAASDSDNLHFRDVGRAPLQPCIGSICICPNYQYCTGPNRLLYLSKLLIVQITNCDCTNCILAATCQTCILWSMMYLIYYEIPTEICTYSTYIYVLCMKCALKQTDHPSMMYPLDNLSRFHPRKTKEK